MDAVLVGKNPTRRLLKISDHQFCFIPTFCCFNGIIVDSGVEILIEPSWAYSVIKLSVIVLMTPGFSSGNNYTSLSFLGRLVLASVEVLPRICTDSGTLNR